MALEFLSGFIRFAEIFSFIKESKSSYFFEWQKRTTPKADSRQKAPSFVKRSKTTPFRIRNSLVKTFSQYLESPSLRGFVKNRSNLNLIKFDFYNLISLINKFYTKWIASLITFVRNDNFNYAFSCALKNKFEIISRNENYAFDYNKYFYRNGNNRIVSSLRGGSRSNLFSGLLRFTRNDGDGLFSRNDYGEKFIFGFWNNFNFGFLFNRKIKK